ncbi:hypothetical protein IMZ48_48975 [Candidatus Bathyarchaeota archaeon]|nr:hypothetical protein [Candidatus Bathyarchaeota archaeon]
MTTEPVMFDLDKAKDWGHMHIVSFSIRILPEMPVEASLLPTPPGAFYSGRLRPQLLLRFREHPIYVQNQGIAVYPMPKDRNGNSTCTFELISSYPDYVANMEDYREFKFKRCLTDFLTNAEWLNPLFK